MGTPFGTEQGRTTATYHLLFVVLPILLARDAADIVRALPLLCCVEVLVVLSTVYSSLIRLLLCPDASSAICSELHSTYHTNVNYRPSATAWGAPELLGASSGSCKLSASGRGLVRNSPESSGTLCAPESSSSPLPPHRHITAPQHCLCQAPTR